MPKKLLYTDYTAMARSKGLRYNEYKAAQTARTPVRWTCETCGTAHVKSYRAVQKAEIGCECRSHRSLSFSKYFELAEVLGVEWIAEKGNLPKNNKSLTHWRSKDNVVFEASYHELFRLDRIPLRLQEYLNMEEENAHQVENRSSS